MAARGLLAGDDDELDRLRDTARQAALARRPGEVEQWTARALDRARSVPIDKRLVERKLQRFNARYDASNAGARARVDALVGRAMDDFTAGRYEASNRALSEGLVLLKDRP
jgi:hypothetical protein